MVAVAVMEEVMAAVMGAMGMGVTTSGTEDGAVGRGAVGVDGAGTGAVGLLTGVVVGRTLGMAAGRTSTGLPTIGQGSWKSRPFRTGDLRGSSCIAIVDGSIRCSGLNSFEALGEVANNNGGLLGTAHQA